MNGMCFFKLTIKQLEENAEAKEGFQSGYHHAIRFCCCASVADLNQDELADKILSNERMPESRIYTRSGSANCLDEGCSSSMVQVTRAESSAQAAGKSPNPNLVIE